MVTNSKQILLALNLYFNNHGVIAKQSFNIKREEELRPKPRVLWSEVNKKNVQN